jgi:multidrug resistance efflux pump
MKTSLLILSVSVASVLGVGSQLYLNGGDRSAAADTGGKPVEAVPEQIAANGVVEGARPEAALRLEVTGLIAAIHVREDQEVARGALLVELANDTQKQKVAQAKAELTIAQADLERLRNGERPERRKAFAAAEEARRVISEQAEADWKRSQRLAGTTASSKEQFDNDRFKMRRARAELAEAVAEHALVEAPARKEDIAAAEGRVAAAEAKLRLAETDLAKTRLTARSAGRILQVHAEPGELATPASVQPLLTMADLSHRRVRAFIEELDAGRVHAGQRAIVTADGYPGQEYAGTVAVVIPRMGKRAPQTDQANEYKDMYFREVLIDLDSSADLPVNLRVQVRIDTSAHQSKLR